MSEATTTRIRGFSYTCPICNETDCLVVEVSDVSQLYCKNCDNEFDAVTLRKTLAQITVILDWLETAPERQEEEA